MKPGKVLIKENQRITHNSIFADFCCLPGFLPKKSETKLSKNRSRSGTRQNPTLPSLSDTIGSPMSPDKNIPPHAWGRTAYMRATNVSESPDPSNKISLLAKSCSIRACPERVQRVERVKQKSAKIGEISPGSVKRASAAPLEKELDPGLGGGRGTRHIEVRARKQQRQSD